MRAIEVSRSRSVSREGHITEIVIWRVPTAVPPSRHSYKYRLAYIVEGKRVIGFDNERGKGDHKHIDGKELPYTFTTPDQLAADFIEAIESYRSRT